MDSKGRSEFASANREAAALQRVPIAELSEAMISGRDERPSPARGASSNLGYEVISGTSAISSCNILLVSSLHFSIIFDSWGDKL